MSDFRIAFFVGTMALLAACGGSVSGADASDGPDDAQNDTPDASVLWDASVAWDAAVTPDASVAWDAAVTPDASVAWDAAVTWDASVSWDAAIQDAAVDAGSALTISNVLIESNPNSVLSCYVSWTTNMPASSVVEFGLSATYSHRISDNALDTTHRVLVIGMTAQTLYHLRAVSVAADLQQVDSGDLTYTTAALPNPIAPASVPVRDPALVQPGWTFTNVRNNGECAAVAYDMSGEPVWYFVVPNNDTSNLDVTPVDGGTKVLIGLTLGDEAVEVDLAGDRVWSGPAKNNLRRSHHHYEKLPSGNYLTLLREVQGGVIGDIVEILAPSHASVWSWNAFDHLTVGTGDWTHGNAAIVDQTNSWAYFNARALSTLFKIDMSDGHVIWSLGSGGDFAADPVATDPWMDGQHAPEILSNGNILLYDNGLVRGYTRVVEYQVDETLMTTSIAWEFPGNATGLDPWYTTGWYSGSRGDVDRLPNGNTLVTSSVDGIIFEVTPNRTVVWELQLPISYTGAYKSERVPPPLIEEI